MGNKMSFSLIQMEYSITVFFIHVEVYTDILVHVEPLCSAAVLRALLVDELIKTLVVI